MSGAIDLTFGDEGCVEIKNPANNYWRVSAAFMPDGKIIVMALPYVPPGGNAKITLTRLLPNGSRDNTFGIDGQVFPDLSVNLSTDETVHQCIPTNEGKLILVGRFNTTDRKGAAFVARLNTNGTLDNTFGQNGQFLVDMGDLLNRPLSALIKPDGKILFGGTSSGYGSLFLVQLLPNGSLDPNFASGGIYLSERTYNFRIINDLALQEDGKIVTFGKRYMDNIEIEIFRFNANGTPDTSFAVDRSRLLSNLLFESNEANSGVVQPDRKLVFSGIGYCSAHPSTNEGEVTLHRLNIDGSLDTTFGTNGSVFTDFGLLIHPSTIALQSDGKILLATAALSVNPYAFNFWLARYNTDGSLDKTFGNGGKVRSPNYNGMMDTGNILLDQDGKIIYASIAEGKVVLWRYLNESITSPLPTLSASVQFQPNPVLEHGMIRWTMGKPDELRGDLFDAQGQLIKQVISPTYYAAGSHQLTVYFDKDTPPGVYYFAITIGNDRQVLKVVKF